MEKAPESVQLLFPYLKGAEAILCTEQPLVKTILSLHDTLSHEDVKICILIAQSEIVRRLSTHEAFLSEFFDKLRDNIRKDPEQEYFKGLI